MKFNNRTNKYNYEVWKTSDIYKRFQDNYISLKKSQFTSGYPDKSYRVPNWLHILYPYVEACTALRRHVLCKKFLNMAINHKGFRNLMLTAMELSGVLIPGICCIDCIDWDEDKYPVLISIIEEGLKNVEY